MRDLTKRKLDRPKLKLHQLLTDSSAWNGYPLCSFKHRNLYNKKDYIFEGRILHEVVEDDFKRYKILTDDGKLWHKHKLLDEVKIIEPGKGKPKEFTIDVPVKI